QDRRVLWIFQHDGQIRGRAWTSFDWLGRFGEWQLALGHPVFSAVVRRRRHFASASARARAHGSRLVQTRIRSPVPLRSGEDPGFLEFSDETSVDRLAELVYYDDPS